MLWPFWFKTRLTGPFQKLQRHPRHYSATLDTPLSTTQAYEHVNGQRSSNQQWKERILLKTRLKKQNMHKFIMFKIVIFSFFKIEDFNIVWRFPCHEGREIFLIGRVTRSYDYGCLNWYVYIV